MAQSPLLLFILLPVTILAAMQEIPPEVLQRLRRVRTHEELESTALLFRSNTTESDENERHEMRVKLWRGSFTSRRRPQTRIPSPGIQGSPTIANKPPLTRVAGVEDLDTEYIHNPVQFYDTCHRMNVCVPLPIQKEPLIYFFPQCIQLERCLGACCDGEQNCHAINTSPVKVLVEKWRYEGIDPTTGNPRFSSKSTEYVNMDRHIACGCQNCRVPRCSPKHEFHNCQCQCINRTEAASCIGGQKLWMENDCECRCQITSCPAGQLLNVEQCRCESFGNSFSQSLNRSRMVPRPSALDQIRLPALKYKRRQKHGRRTNGN